MSTSEEPTRTTDFVALAEARGATGLRQEVNDLVAFAVTAGAIDRADWDHYAQRYACDPDGTRAALDMAVAGARGVSVQEVRSTTGYPAPDTGGPADPLNMPGLQRGPRPEGRSSLITRGD